MGLTKKIEDWVKGMSDKFNHLQTQLPEMIRQDVEAEVNKQLAEIKDELAGIQKQLERLHKEA